MANRKNMDCSSQSSSNPQLLSTGFSKKQPPVSQKINEKPARDAEPQTFNKFELEQEKTVQKLCYNCGLVWTVSHRCKAVGAICRKCGKKGHFKRVCHSTHSKNKNENGTSSTQLGQTANDTAKSSTRLKKTKTVDDRKGKPNKNKGINDAINKTKTNSPSNDNHKDLPHGTKGAKANKTTSVHPNGASTVNRASEQSAAQKKDAANKLYSQKKYKLALTKYSQLIEMCPTSDSNFGNRAACYMMMDNYNAAISDAKKSVELNSKFIKGYTRLVKCAIILGNFSEALNGLIQLANIEPANDLLDWARKQITDVQDYAEKCEDAMDVKDYATALNYIDKCIEISHHCIAYKIKKGKVLIGLENYKQAENIAKDILTHDPCNFDAKLIIGQFYYYTDIDKASSYVKDLLYLEPDHSKLQEIYKKAKSLADIKTDGNAAFHKKKYAQAWTLYTEALKIDPENKNVNMKLYYNQSQASYKMGKIRQSIDECNKALAIDTKYVKALVRRGLCNLDLNDYEAAVNDFSNAYKLDPTLECARLLIETWAPRKAAKCDYHSILGVNKDATYDELKNAYHEKALIHHPDRHPNAAEKALNEIQFKEITRAYRILTNRLKPRCHSNYDDDEESDYDNDDDDDEDYYRFMDEIFANCFGFAQDSEESEDSSSQSSWEDCSEESDSP